MSKLQQPPEGLEPSGGLVRELPPEIAEGLDTSKPDLLERRKPWNRYAPPEYALPTEIWREVVERRKRYFDIRKKIESGEIKQINDFITYNLNIRQFAQDAIEQYEGSDFVNAFYKAITRITVLDPACGSGAFLFAALNVLESLYEACIERMQQFVSEDEEQANHDVTPAQANDHTSTNVVIPAKAGIQEGSGDMNSRVRGNDRSGKKGRKYPQFRKVLAEIKNHPNLRYYIYKSIILNNLYGVDIMKEAVEIAKLRLFLKLMAEVEHIDDVEPMPDIDYNIRAGNSLVGFATYEDLRKAIAGKGQARLDLDDVSEKFKEQADVVGRAYKHFKEIQLESDHKDDSANHQSFKEAKNELEARLRELNEELDGYLANTYGVVPANETRFAAWKQSHQPFHWFAEFYEIVHEKGGFDAVIGNPPYREYKEIVSVYTILNFETERCGNIYVYFIERSFELSTTNGKIGLIVPISLTAAQRMQILQHKLINESQLLCLSNFALRPAALFPGIMQRITIFVSQKGEMGETHTTDYITWYSEERSQLFHKLSYVELDGLRLSYSIPKMNNEIAYSALSKITAIGRYWNHYNEFKGKHIIYYHNAGGYWIKTFDFRPYYRSLVQPNKKHTTISELNLPSEDLATTYLCLLNSSLFYFFWKSLTDARHVYPSDIAMFPIELPLEQNLIHELAQLEQYLMTCFRQNCTRITYGKSEVDQYEVLPCKSIIDEIDKVLAKHYGFTEEELDFIMNYDIKYRMGKELNR